MSTIKIPTWFWVVSGLALVWNLMGVIAFAQTMLISPEALAKMSEAELELQKNTPTWANGAFAFAVIGGFLGSLLLLLKKKASLIILIVSLLAILVQMYNAFFIMDTFAVFGPGGVIMPVMVIVVGILLIGLAKTSIKKGWIN